MLKKFWKWLTAAAKREPRKAHPDLRPLDVEKLAAELNLVEEAARLGAAKLPASDSISISGPEAAVVQKVEKARQDYVDWAVFRLSVLSQNMARRDITRDISRAKEAANDFEQKASAILNEHDSVLSALAEDASSKKVELEDFRENHQLKRKARYPSGTRTYLLYSLLTFLILVEGVLNAVFFSQGMDSGLIGGFITAALLAAVNVAIAFSFGKFCIPYVGHIKLSLTAFGVLSVLMAVGFMVSIGLGIAHYRDALTNDVQVPAQAALTTLMSEPLHLQDVFSWALFAISIAFATASLFDGLYSDDLYPSYGKICRSAGEAVDDYEDQLAFVRTELEELKDEAIESLEQTVKGVQAASADFESLVEDKRTAKLRLSTALRDADHSLEALLRKFRTENELHRNGASRPPYFDELPCLRPLQLPNFDTAEDETTLNVQKELISGLLVDIEQIRARIQGAFNQRFDRLRPLDEHFTDKAAA
jgi:hypothetical protein